MGVEGLLPWVALGTTVDWGRAHRAAMGQMCSEVGLPKGVVAEAMEKKRAKRKVKKGQPPSGLGEWDREE